MKALINFEIAEEFLRATGIQVIPLPSYPRLDSPVASHADMLFCVIDNVVFCYEDYVVDNWLMDIIQKEGYEIVFVSNKCEKEYPRDISLNVLIMGKTLFSNVKYTAKEVLTYAENNGFSIVNVKQGYAACSTLVIDENTAVTSDIGIAKAIESVGKKAILLNFEEIILDGYDHGFIGGATTKINNKIYIFGEIFDANLKKEFEQICKEKNCSVISVLHGRVYDFGGVKLL